MIEAGVKTEVIDQEIEAPIATIISEPQKKTEPKLQRLQRHSELSIIRYSQC